MDTKEKTKGEEDTQVNKARLTVTCKNLKSIEKFCSEIVQRAKERPEVKVRGPVRMPVKTLKITCRKTPCGEGSKTWDKFEMRIYKRVLDLTCTQAAIKEITSIKIEPGVEVELAITSEESK